LGYVHCAQELLAQATTMNVAVDHVVHATGSAGTQAGLVVGFESAHAEIPVLGVSVSQSRAVLESRVHRLAAETAALMQVPPPSRAAVMVDDDHVGPGYGIATPQMVEAIQLVARTEGVLLDPVYSGKAMAGLVDAVRTGHFATDANVVFVHTGGVPGLFAYGTALSTEGDPSR